ncbi:MAG: inositol monophosphatase family protein [Acidobacteriota bacterium]
MRSYLDVGVEAARLAGEVLKESYGRGKTIEYKGENNLVTHVDKRSESLVTEFLTSRFPKHAVLGEEGTNTRPESEYRWVIDPLDGTTNYAHDYPFFCVSIGLEYQGELIVGVVYHPIFEELFVAEKGGGAYLNGKRIQVSKVDKLRQALLATGFPYDVDQNPGAAFDYFQEFVKAAQAVRRDGSAALDLCYLAMGRFDGFWEVRLNPWDTAAGVLILREAGGRVTDFDGNEYVVSNDPVLASNSLIHSEMQVVINRYR